MAQWLALPALLDDDGQADDQLPDVDFARLLAELEANRPAWHEHAACAGAGPALFFPERGQDDRPGKALCASCPVAEPCLTDALQRGDGTCPGIWGGTSARERRKLRQAARPAA